MFNQYDQLIDSFLQNDIGIDNEFLTEKLSAGLLQHIVQLQKDEQFVFAGIGNDVLRDSGQKMRGDQIYWLDKKHDNIFEQEFLTHIDHFIERLNSTCYTGINGYEFHYAVYEEGSVYKRHKDQFRNDSNRKFSLISYLNKSWQEAEGGQLVVYQDGKENSILPESRKAVFFKSDEMEHEVTKASRSRMSITGWLKTI